MVILSFYFLICRPQSMTNALMEEELRQKQEELRGVRQELAEIPNPESYARELRNEQRRVLDLLPDNDAVTALLVTLNNLAKEHNVRISSVKQGSFTDRKTYYEIPLEMMVAGNYPDLLRFVQKMEHLKRYNTIMKIGVQGEESLVTMKLSVVVYAYGPMPQNIQTRAKAQR